MISIFNCLGPRRSLFSFSTLKLRKIGGKNWGKQDSLFGVFLCSYPIKVPQAGPMGGTALLLLDNFHSIVKWAKQARHLIGTKWQSRQVESSTK
jgi:hypothetical protein